MKDSAGNTIVGMTTTRSGGVVIISSPDLVSGATYVLYNGTNEIGSVTITDKINTIGSVNTGNNPGGPGAGGPGAGGPGAGGPGNGGPGGRGGMDAGTGATTNA